MTWSDFYAGCFLVGFLLSAASFLMGSADIHIGDDAAGDSGAADAAGADGHGHHGHAHVSFFNFGTAAAFLAWFGGAGFILTRYSSVWAGLALGLATVSGLAGAAVVFWFLAKVLVKSEKNLDPADYSPVGALGKLSEVIRPGGVGEMIFSQQGSRRAVAARSEDGGGIPKGTEVVVTRYEKGIAYVRHWEDLE